MEKKNKIIVTGGLGHIGSKLIRVLPEVFPESEIVIIDNLMTQRYCSLFKLPKERYRFIEGDVRRIPLDKIFEENDIVVNFSAITDASLSHKNPEETEDNNYNCTSKIVDSCLKVKAKLITFSSTSVYSTQKNEVDEECSEEELMAQSPYARTKRKEEKLIQSIVKTDKLKAVVFRLGTIVGTSPGMRFHTAVNKFCWQAAFGLPITVWKTAFDQMRPYLVLEDACNSISEFLKKDIFDGEIYNVVTSNTTVRDITDIIKKYVPDLKIEFIDSPIMNNLSYEVKSEKIKNKIKILWSNGLEESIREELELLNIDTKS